MLDTIRYSLTHAMTALGVYTVLIGLLAPADSYHLGRGHCGAPRPRRSIMRTTRKRRRLGLVVALGLSGAALIAGCGGGDEESKTSAIIYTKGELPPLTRAQIFDLDGELSATIRRTTNGVPHILADNLESAAFGVGYVQARDNVCLLAAQIIRATSQLARYFGPGPNNINIIMDFSFKALGIQRIAEKRFATLSPVSRAMLRGHAAGYNKYLAATDAADLPRRCAGKPWVQPITARELFAAYRILALYASGLQFIGGALFNAVPPGADPIPAPVTQTSRESRQNKGRFRTLAWKRNTRRPSGSNGIGLDLDLTVGSNGWAIGGELTETGRGALLANPHLAYTGLRRFYQFQITVPGVVNAMGAGLLGFPVPIVEFNEQVAWTGTVSAASRFTVYKLDIVAGNPLAYVKNGEVVPITTRTFRIKVDMGSNLITLERRFYYSEYGPMLSLNTLSGGRLPEWNNEVAYTYRDANMFTAGQVIDQFLGMARSANLNQFKSVFEDCGSVLWSNILYADMAGNAFYIDGSSVPHLSDPALAALHKRIRNQRITRLMFKQGLVLLDGSTSRDDWIAGSCGRGLVPFEQAPKLLRRDFVQNSNDSYWATNPRHPLSGYSLLYGTVGTPLSPRSRMGLAMLTRPTDPGLSNTRPAGQDGKFDARDMINAHYSNRAFRAEMLLDELLHRCNLIGTNAVIYAQGKSRSVARGCAALRNWDGVYNVDSRGAGTFRVFAEHYDDNLPDAFTVAFDPKHPIATPRNPKPVERNDLAHDPMLQALARGLDDLDQVGIAYDAPLGRIQKVILSTSTPPGGNPEVAAVIPWPGGSGSAEGAFNVATSFAPQVAVGTRFPIVGMPGTIPNTAGLSTQPHQGWVVGHGTGWHFALIFTDDGPLAYGLVSYSQSTDPSSPYFKDQHQRYSNENYREFRFTEREIRSDPNFKKVVITMNSLTRLEQTIPVDSTGNS